MFGGVCGCSSRVCGCSGGRERRLFGGFVLMRGPRTMSRRTVRVNWGQGTGARRGRCGGKARVTEIPEWGKAFKPPQTPPCQHFKKENFSVDDRRRNVRRKKFSSHFFFSSEFFRRNFFVRIFFVRRRSVVRPSVVRPSSVRRPSVRPSVRPLIKKPRI